jgi:hypothetical protein
MGKQFHFLDGTTLFCSNLSHKAVQWYYSHCYFFRRVIRFFSSLEDEMCNFPSTQRITAAKIILEPISFKTPITSHKNLLAGQ